MGTTPLLEPYQPLVFFDENCLLCNRSVKFLLKYDRQQLCYSGYNSKLAKDVLPQYLIDNPQTIIFLHGKEMLFQSQAIFKIISHLRFPWQLFRVFSILPTSVTDIIYRWIARRRISWFGRLETCFVSTPEQKSRVFEQRFLVG